MSESIYFFRPWKDWGEFSNFYEHPILIEGVTYGSVEAYFQSSKFRGTGERGNEYADIIALSTPDNAYNLGKQRKHRLVKEYKDVKIRPDWEYVKDFFMRRGVFAKFWTNPRLKVILLSTGDSYIYENSPYDSYWGLGRKKKGKNRLGEIIMEIRTIVRILEDIPVQIEEPFFEKSNWVTPNKSLLASAYPGSKDDDEGEIVNQIISEDEIDVIVSLMTEDEMIGNKMLKVGKYKEVPIPLEDYRPFVPDEVEIIHYPIEDQETTDDDNQREMVDNIFMKLQEGRRVLIHCYGGKGRTGVTTALLVAMIYGMDADTALTIVQRMFEMRVKKGSRKFLKTPYTEDQVQQVRRIDDSWFRFIPICE